MFELNGIVYGKNLNAIRIHDAKLLPDKIFLVTFESGETRLFDATILTGKVFDPLKDEKVLENFRVDHGVLTWADGEIDCSPEFIYENSYEYSVLNEA